MFKILIGNRVRNSGKRRWRAEDHEAAEEDDENDESGRGAELLKRVGLPLKGSRWRSVSTRHAKGDDARASSLVRVH